MGMHWLRIQAPQLKPTLLTLLALLSFNAKYSSLCYVTFFHQCWMSTCWTLLLWMYSLCLWCTQLLCPQLDLDGKKSLFQTSDLDDLDLDLDSHQGTENSNQAPEQKRSRQKYSSRWESHSINFYKRLTLTETAYSQCYSGCSDWGSHWVQPSAVWTTPLSHSLLRSMMQ